MPDEPDTSLEAVRRRPAMYFGDVHDGFGLHQLAWELIGNCVDQFFAGNLSKIDVRLTGDGRIRVSDDGPGISLAREPDGRTFLERVLTELHHGPTADGHKPHLHMTMPGVGLGPVCAVSLELEVEVQNADGHFRQTFARGSSTSPLTRVGDPTGTGTTIEVLPDTEIFRHLRWDPTRIDRSLRELALLCPGLRTSFGAEPHTHGPAPDLSALVEDIAVGRPLHPDVILCAAKDGHMEARVGIRWCEPRPYGPPGRVDTFCNLQPTRDGGAHLRGFERGVAHALIRHEGRDPTCAPWLHTYDILAAGLYAVVSVTLIDPTYNSPTRDRLATPAAADLVQEAVTTGLAVGFERTPDLATLLLDRVSRAPVDEDADLPDMPLSQLAIEILEADGLVSGDVKKALGRLIIADVESNARAARNKIAPTIRREDWLPSLLASGDALDACVHAWRELPPAPRSREDEQPLLSALEQAIEVLDSLYPIAGAEPDDG